MLSSVTICTSGVGDDLCALDLDHAALGWSSECSGPTVDACELSGVTCVGSFLEVDLRDEGLAGTLDKDWSTLTSLTKL